MKNKRESGLSLKYSSSHALIEGNSPVELRKQNKNYDCQCSEGFHKLCKKYEQVCCKTIMVKRLDKKTAIEVCYEYEK